jgi:hypothetical protein
MRARTLVWLALIGVVASDGMLMPSHAATGSVRVTFSKAGFIAGFGSGSGVLTFRGKRYPFDVSGASLGATIGISTNQLQGRAYNLHKPEDLAGSYGAAGVGGAVAAGVGGVRLRNPNGVILALWGAKMGVELSASVAHVTISMK